MKLSLYNYKNLNSYLKHEMCRNYLYSMKSMNDNFEMYFSYSLKMKLQNYLNLKLLMNSNHKTYYS